MKWLEHRFVQVNTGTSRAFVKFAMWIAYHWADPFITDGIASKISSHSQKPSLKLCPSALPFPGTGFALLLMMFIWSIQSIQPVFTDPTWSITWEIFSGIIHMYSVFLSQVICCTSQSPKALYWTSILEIKSIKYWLIILRKLAKYSEKKLQSELLTLDMKAKHESVDKLNWLLKQSVSPYYCSGFELDKSYYLSDRQPEHFYHSMIHEKRYLKSKCLQ